MFPILSLLIWVPMVGALLSLLFKGERSKYVALLTSLITLGLCVPLYWGFDGNSAAYQWIEIANWIPSLNIQYSLGVDGFSLPLIILTCFFTPLVILSAWKCIDDRPAQYMAAFLIMQGLMCGVFSAIDSILFYVFWEGMLIPMFLIIGIWGGTDRIYATIKFFLYTFLGSVFLLVALIYLYLSAHSFSIPVLKTLSLSLVEQKWIFMAFLVAFAVKIPMWPVHTWLPDAHTEAPTGGSVVLAAILLKMGAYGFLRFMLPIVPEASMVFAPLMIALSIIAITYIAFVAISQQDMKKLIAYSSIAHMGFVTLGIFISFGLLEGPNASFNIAVMGVEGAYFQMISHGFISGALFFCVGVLYDRMHTRKIADYGGVLNTMPVFGSLFIFFALANAGLPGTSGFVGEFLVILSTFKLNFWVALLAATILVLGASYSLWMIKRVVFGEVKNPQVAALKDINRREFLYLSILALIVLLFGCWPAPLLNLTHESVIGLLESILRAPPV